MFVGSCLITLKENPRVYPWIKIFSYGLPTQDHGEGRAGRGSMSEICYAPCVSFTSRRVRIIKTVARRGLRLFCHFWNVKNNIQLSPEGEVNSGAYNLYWHAKRRGIYQALWTDPEGDSCFSIYQISWKKIKKELFVNKRRHLARVCLRFNWQCFRNHFLWFCCKFSQKFFFLPASKHRQAQFCLILGICWCSCFIYR